MILHFTTTKASDVEMIQHYMGLLLLAGCAMCMGPVVRPDKFHHTKAGHRTLRSPRRIHQKEETHVEEVLSRERRRHERASNEFNNSATSAEVSADDPSKDLPMERLRRAFGRNDYLLPENFKTLRRSDIPVTYRLHDDLLRYYRKGTRPVTHPNKIVSVSMSVFLYQIVKLSIFRCTRQSREERSKIFDKFNVFVTICGCLGEYKHQQDAALRLGRREKHNQSFGKLRIGE
ncbi:hypothetical protein Y032_0067g78 [Ancylostoma ceylanicum]|uniref:Neurotransmitter-gated ion-channel ligand-binding domain-containing protein n=1 Tax=Ancylostoma ceylanicum TaxID=53326 RepID=A0A016U087_9BILA|nr:hypothetical protein Y032_0067g78 [Ancylostoma ceylanicum]